MSAASGDGSAGAASDPALLARIAANFERQGLMATLGATLSRVALGEVQIDLPCSAAVSQQQGFVHAGAVTAIVDSACGYAALTHAAQGDDVVSVEFKINLLRPAVGERLEAIGRTVRAGKAITVCQGEVFALGKGQRTLVAVMQATMMRVEVGRGA